MNDRILEIVFYLMDYLHEGQVRESNLSDVSVDLKWLGFSEEEITRAYSWMLEHYQGGRERLYSAFPDKTSSVRVLTELERALLTAEAHGLLVRLTESDLVGREHFEEILDRCAVFAERPVTADHVKLIVSLVVMGEHENLDRLSPFGDDADTAAGIN